MTPPTDANHDPQLVRLSPDDNVLVLAADVDKGQTLTIGGQTVAFDKAVALGHKIAAHDIAAGEKIIKYGAPIGSATCAITTGQHVHVHNMKSDYLPTFTLDGQNAYIQENKT